MPVFISHVAERYDALFRWLEEEQRPTPERYMRSMASLELCWRRTVPQLSFTVEHDEPERLPGTATRTAMAAFAALQDNEPTRQWFAKHIRNAVVHSAFAADGIVVVGDSIHFYQVKEFKQALGPQLFDRLTEEQRQDFAELNPGSDPRQVFTQFVDRIILTHADKDLLRGAYELASKSIADRQDWVATHPHAMQKWFLTQTMVDSPDVAPMADEEWTEEKNARRCQLIDEKIQESLTPEEAIELQKLQQQAMAYRDAAVEPRLAAARQLHKELLDKKNQREQKN